MKTICIFTEPKPNFDTKVSAVLKDINECIGYELKGLRVFYRFTVNGVEQQNIDTLVNSVISNPTHDFVYFDGLPTLTKGTTLLCVEYLPGHFDSRSDSAEIAAQLAFGGQKPSIKVALVYAFEGLKDDDLDTVKKKLINFSESRAVEVDNWKDEQKVAASPSDIPVIEGFNSFSDDELLKIREEYSLAMALSDLQCLRTYFSEEKRNPTLTEIKVFDVYWSDHCRHTTFNTVIDNIVINDDRVKAAYELFLKVNGKRKFTLMNVATAAMRYLRDNNKLPLLYDTGENNACTIKVSVDAGGQKQDWLLLFKNETHNHPTEIEPFAGASTCTGGAIRDPMSGRAFVYQALRLTGAGDPRADVSTTLEGKLPQKTLTTTAAAGNSSYGNQIGLASSLSKEIFHPGYVAKRMEGGAVVGAVPLDYTRFETPAPGDVVMLIGRPTGRDGLGGASSSSKTSNKTQELQCGEEVPKGNPLEEHKIQRLFKDKQFLKLIKRCNDFGAGGVSVAIGEICDGLLIDLDAIPCKYEGMDGTDLAISESQERMAVVVSASDEQLMKQLCLKESVNATTVAVVTKEPRMIMKWRGKEIVNIKRSFLSKNGAEKHIDAEVVKYTPYAGDTIKGDTLEEKLLNLAGDLNFCSQKGIGQYFDGSVNASSVFAGAGGKEMLTEAQAISSLFPCKDCNTASVLAYGFDPYISNQDPFGGAVNAVVTSVAKLVASGADLNTVYLSFQEFFPSAKDDKKRWGAQTATMLGAFWAQMQLNIAAIGGKDSCSGTYGTLDVPQTLVSFAIAVADAKDIISPEFKKTNSFVYLFNAPSDFEQLKCDWGKIGQLIKDGKIIAARACEKGGAYGSIIKMCLGNKIGFDGKADKKLFDPQQGSIVFESTCQLDDYKLLGKTTDKKQVDFDGTVISLDKLDDLWQAPLEKIFPVKPYTLATEVKKIDYSQTGLKNSATKAAKPLAVIPVFHGTNCETDMANAIEKAGGIAKLVIMKNLNPTVIEESIKELCEAIKQSQMLVLAGGFADVDVAGGSANIITSILRRQNVSDAVSELLYNRDGLMLGVCNGFQALVKLGLIPYGKFTAQSQNSPILTTNLSGRASCGFTNVRISSVKSPWMSCCKVGDIYTLPFAHGEGRFVASQTELKNYEDNGQIASQYCDNDGNPTMDIAFNPNGSCLAIEGLTSPDGRILGRMTHAERIRKHVAKNITGNKELPLFEGGVAYFK